MDILEIPSPGRLCVYNVRFREASSQAKANSDFGICFPECPFTVSEQTGTVASPAVISEAVGSGEPCGLGPGH